MPRKDTARSKLCTPWRQIEEGKKVSEVCREMRVSAAGGVPMEASLWWIGIERSSGAAAVARGESQAEGHRSGLHVRQTHPARGALKKV